MSPQTENAIMSRNLAKHTLNGSIVDRRRAMQFALGALAAARFVLLPSGDGVTAQTASGDGDDGTMATGDIVGAGISFSRNARIEMSQSVGHRTAGGADVNGQTRFQAASISKTVNSCAVLMLADVGRLELDRPVNAQLRRWQVPGPFGDTVTPSMLLSHTAGTSVSGFPGYPRDSQVPTLVDILNGAGHVNTMPVVADQSPGQFRYSGGGTSVLQLLVEDVTDQPYASFVQETVFAPLGMTRSTYQAPDRPVTNAANGHYRDRRAVEGGFRLYPELAAAGLWTTPADLCRMSDGILRSLRGHADAVLSRETALRMTSPVVGPSALGIFVSDDGVLFHAGFNAGFVSLLLADPASMTSVAIMVNSEADPNVLAGLFDGVRAPFPFRM
ncbi:serine hydrolase domain-containing protein [Phaeobacter inhibens]|uniref:serine hydrolase domain-containing protein n=1 Tax=Phaeobacter inhibens TaxID=221822 RepID=UPI0021A3B93F|nr:serine hydrolase domain-containing protein [Phaeobacter inhibens]UWR47026.1 beta-lactamase family protein [Phaeobacter inhibens]